MKVITSQGYRACEIVEAKKDVLAGRTSIDLVVWETGLQDLDGEDVCILSDGHHTYEAAQELGLKINYIVENHPEGLTGEDLLDVAWMDEDYHYLESGLLVWQITRPGTPA